MKQDELTTGTPRRPLGLPAPSEEDGGAEEGDPAGPG